MVMIHIVFRRFHKDQEITKFTKFLNSNNSSTINWQQSNCNVQMAWRRTVSFLSLGLFPDQDNGAKRKKVEGSSNGGSSIMCDDSEQDIKPRIVPSNVPSDLHRIETKHRTKERNNNYRTKKRNKECTKQRKIVGGRSPLKKNKRKDHSVGRSDFLLDFRRRHTLLNFPSLIFPHSFYLSVQCLVWVELR